MLIRSRNNGKSLFLINSNGPKYVQSLTIIFLCYQIKFRDAFQKPEFSTPSGRKNVPREHPTDSTLVCTFNQAVQIATDFTNSNKIQESVAICTAWLKVQTSVKSVSRICVATFSPIGVLISSRISTSFFRESPCPVRAS